jgi:hypothetical protein
VQSLSFEGSHLEDVPYLGLPEVAVFGRSNVGKSSLLNCLAGTNKGVAVVSKTPGRTQVRAFLPSLCQHLANACADLFFSAGSGVCLYVCEKRRSTCSRCTTRRGRWRWWWTCRATAMPSCPRHCRQTSACR